MDRRSWPGNGDPGGSERPKRSGELADPASRSAVRALKTQIGSIATQGTARWKECVKEPGETGKSRSHQEKQAGSRCWWMATGGLLFPP